MDEPRKQHLGWVGLYDDVDSLVRAAERIRDSKHPKWDCHTPYPVHGLDRAMGLRPSLVPYVTLTAGLVGLLTAIALTGGLSVLHYPIRVGGKALFSWQAFVPIYFELFVLFAGLATMAAVVGFCRLGRWHSPLHDSGVMQEVMSDRFAITLEATAEGHTDDQLKQMLLDTGCQDIRPLVQFEEEDDSIL
jgi:hypothetical protein